MQLEDRCKESLANLCRTNCRLYDVGVTALYREFLFPVGDLRLSPCHLAALKSPTNLGVHHIKTLHFVRHLDEDRMCRLVGPPYTPQDIARSHEDGLHKDQQEKDFVKHWLDCRRTSLQHYGSTQARRASECQDMPGFPFLNVNVTFKRSGFVTPIGALKHIGLGQLTAWIEANAQSLQRLCLSKVGNELVDDYGPVGGDSELLRRLMKDELFNKSELLARPRPVLPALTSLELIDFLLPNEYLVDLCSLLDLTQVTHVRLDALTFDRHMLITRIRELTLTLTNLTSLWLGDLKGSEINSILPALRPLKELHLVLAAPLPHPAIFRSHSETLKVFHFLSDVPIPLKKLNEDYHIPYWPKLEVLFVSTPFRVPAHAIFDTFIRYSIPSDRRLLHPNEISPPDPDQLFPLQNLPLSYVPSSPKMKPRQETNSFTQDEKLRLPPTLKALHMTESRFAKFPALKTKWTCGRYDDPRNCLLNKDDMIEYQKQKLYHCPHLSFPAVKAGTRFPIRALAIYDGTEFKPYYFSPLHDDNNVITDWEPTTIEDIVTKDPDLEALRVEENGRRYSFRDLGRLW
ncbi:hypothetical protein Dda_8161 [Drechslerella dactyloides]|uniref:Uncharacterized protein n=1 Tax=Drechslerella dactyloides TaxID=74499 RepID=A0AAD6NGG3_DREDA|nr:hypothetical protein Dda_8161 [Drechslerella dactyloides]